MSYNLITILGPTAVGKTSLAAKLAFEFNGEIISADSRQVYRGMDIGTGKDLDDYVVNNTSIPYHLIDIIDPTEEFNLFLFQKLFHKTYREITEKNVIPFLVGGTGLYIESILKSYDLVSIEKSDKRKDELHNKSQKELVKILSELNPDTHNTTDLLEKERTIQAILIEESKTNSEHPIENSNIHSFVLGVREDREKIKKNITLRLKHRLKNGMIDEIDKLIKNGVTSDKLYFFGLEYRFVGMYLKGELNYNDMYQKLNSAIHQFAKRQMTWFRKMERNGIKITWLEGPDFPTAVKFINEQEFEF
jgi:tRNA dimethylallyltransferase